MTMKKFAELLLTVCLMMALLPAAAFAATNVPYVNAQGEAQTPVANATDITSGTTAWSNGGWYYASGNVVIGNRVTVSGTVNLILADGATLTANQGIGVSSGNTLIIWAQSGGTGKLIATGTGANAGIGGTYNYNSQDSRDAGTITINGGNITVTGGDGGGDRDPAAIGGAGDNNTVVSGGKGGNITINGGNVTATGKGGGAGIGGAPDAGWLQGGITITGGVITANSLGGSPSGGGVEKVTVSGCPVIVCTGYRNTQHNASWRSGILFTDNGIWATGTVFGNPTLDRNVSLGALGHEKNLMIPQGSTLTVPEGFTFSTGGGGTVTNEGTIVNNGTFSSAKLVNKSAITNNGNLRMTASWEGDISSNIGTINNGENGIVKSTQRLTGTGSIVTNGVKFELTNLTANPSARTLTHNNTDYTTTLSASANYRLPKNITVTVGGVLLGTSNYDYNSQTGQITIPASQIKGNIKITAAGDLLYTITVTAETTNSSGGTVDQSGGTVKVTIDGTTYEMTDGEITTTATAGTLVSLDAYANTSGSPHYRFNKWESTDVVIDQETNEATGFTMPSGNVQIKAVFTESEYWVVEVHHDTAGTGSGSAVASPDSAQANMTVTLKATAHEGSEFKGWTNLTGLTLADDQLSSSEVTFPMPDGNVTVYAKFDLIKYSIRYELDGGNLPDGVNNPSTYTYNDTITLAAPVKTGYVFAGWTGTGLNGTASNVTIPLHSTGDRSYKAIWSPASNTPYTVEHYFQNIQGDGYTLDASRTQLMNGTTGQSTAATTLNVQGFTAQQINQETIEADGRTAVKIYYTRNAYTVIFKPSNGEKDIVSTVRYGAPIPLPETPVRNGYHFIGWSPELPAAMPAEDMTFTAMWAPELPQTGDDSNIHLWMLLCLMSCASMVGVIMHGKKSRTE